MKYCSDIVSRKIAVLSTIATVAVVVIHCNSLEAVKQPSWAFWAGNAIAFLQHWAVPFFFMVSGFFFDRAFFGVEPCRKGERGEFWSRYRQFIGKKFKSLAIPYVLWGSVFGFLTMVPLKMYVNHQHGDPILLGTVFQAQGVWNVIDQVVGITSGNFINALWYVRLLLIVFITAPIWFGIRRVSKWLTLIIGLSVMLLSPTVTLNGYECGGFAIGSFFIQLAGIGWILLGMAVSAFHIENAKISKGVVLTSGLLWVGMSALVIQNRLVEAPWHSWLREWFRIAPLFLIVVWWGGYDYCPRLLPEKLPEWFGWRFWVYCMHHPMSGWCGGIVYAVVGHGLIGRCIWQVVLVPIVLLVCLFAAFVTRRFAPKLFAVLCGGR